MDKRLWALVCSTFFVLISCNNQGAKSSNKSEPTSENYEGKPGRDVTPQELKAMGKLDQFSIDPPSFDELRKKDAVFSANVSYSAALLATPSELKDVKAHPYESEIRNALDLGLLSGYEDKTFKPNAFLKREEMAAIIYQALRRLPGQPLELPSKLNESPFADVSLRRWSIGVIALSTQLGILKGYEQAGGKKNLFRPEQQLTRAELMAILRSMVLYVRKASKLEPLESPLFKTASPGVVFTDIPEKHWAKQVISDMARYCNAAHVADKKQGTQFSPDAPASRGFAAASLVRTFSCLNDETTPPVNRQAQLDIPSFTEEQMNNVSSAPPVVLPDSLDDIVLPDGTTIGQSRKDFEAAWREIEAIRASEAAEKSATAKFATGNDISEPVSQMLNQEKTTLKSLLDSAYRLAISLSANKTFTEEGPDAPAQTKLAYSFGSRNYLSRMAPPFGRMFGGDKKEIPSCWDTKVYGLDCSGMIANLASRMGFANLLPPPGYKLGGVLELKSSQYQLYEDHWRERLPKNTGFNVVTLLNPDISEIEHGDVVGWFQKGHIGMVFNTSTTKDSKELAVFHSNGVHEKDNRNPPDNCIRNRSSGRGPNRTPLTMVVRPSWFGPIERAIRIIEAPKIIEITPKRGDTRAQQKVTILGSGFTKDSDVLFGAKSATSVVFVSSNKLEAIPPEDLPSGQHLVAVSNPELLARGWQVKSNAEDKFFVNEPKSNHSHKWFDGLWSNRTYLGDDSNGNPMYFRISYTIERSTLVAMSSTPTSQPVANNGSKENDETRSVGVSTRTDGDRTLTYTFTVHNENEASLTIVGSVGPGTTVGSSLTHTWKRTSPDVVQITFQNSSALPKFYNRLRTTP